MDRIEAVVMLRLIVRLYGNVVRSKLAEAGCAWEAEQHLALKQRRCLKLSFQTYVLVVCWWSLLLSHIERGMCGDGSVECNTAITFQVVVLGRV
jgi:hypothetical protein